MAFTYQPLQDSRRHIRLLQIDGHDAAADRISCSILHDSLDNDPKFTALSYVWGDPSQPRTILLQGQEVNVTRNLYFALERHAKFPKSQVSQLWIDALCINQADDEEKGRQVQLMGTIYSNATQVLIWLGPADDASVDALHQLSLLGTTFEDVEAREDSGPVVRQAFVKTVLDLSGTSINFAHIQSLFRRPWWTRVWVVQEALLARQAYVLVGDHAQDWKHIRRAWSAFEWMILYVDTDPKYRPIYEVLSDVYFKIAHFTHGDGPGSGTRKSMSLFEAVFYSAASGAVQSTDPRDRIYGLLGLLDDRDRVRIPVDYSREMTLEKILFFTTKALIEDHGPDVLSYRRTTSLSARAPSWTVDWTVKMISTIGGFNFGSNHYDASNGRVWSLSTAFDATFENPTICLSGAVVGHIKKTGSILRSTADSPSYIQDCKSWLLELEDLVRSNFEDGAAKEEIVQNLWRVPIADIGLVERAKPDDGFAEAYRILTGAVKPPPDVAQGDWVSSETWPYRRVWKVYGHRVFVLDTAEEAPGLGPDCICPGDMVVIFSGSHVPFVVRENSQGCSLIGPAYAYGYMDGEAFEDIVAKHGLRDIQLC
ncbi:heterokaryon incompatibility protein [Colletotrichum plurivorum]|uniref:Heterokaryon incompatibility protein n=1 Tax=Colletotrichum plurivorum TaxID=2175906 RepID=A0A8H6K0R5_9PEZI|nr:heterokaryon incompatibility protein [Colletotrichum plurivorum]